MSAQVTRREHVRALIRRDERDDTIVHDSDPLEAHRAVLGNVVGTGVPCIHCGQRELEAPWRLRGLERRR